MATTANETKVTPIKNNILMGDNIVITLANGSLIQTKRLKDSKKANMVELARQIEGIYTLNIPSGKVWRKNASDVVKALVDNKCKPEDLLTFTRYSDGVDVYVIQFKLSTLETLANLIDVSVLKQPARGKNAKTTEDSTDDTDFSLIG